MMRSITIALLLLFVCCRVSPQFEIIKVERTVNLGGFYAIQAIKVSYKALEEASSFIHAIPLEYDSKVAQILFRRNARDNKRPLVYTKSSQIVNGVSVILYHVEIGHIGEHETGELFISISNLNRFVNKPKIITLIEDQKVEYEDAKYFVSPYKVRDQESIFKFQKIISFDQDGEKRGLNSAVFRGSNSMGYNFTKTTVFGVNHNPLVQFSKVHKTIDVSHWGAIAIVQTYSIYNVGPSLKGEFSRVSFSSKNEATARTAFRGIEFDLPYGVQGLYYRDEVGNVTTSKAFRDDSSQAVRVYLAPRFGILGGWKSNWEIGYNINVQDQLVHQNDKYELKNIELDYSIDKIFSENYKVDLILPQGAENVHLELNGEPIDMNTVKKEVTKGYLDFNGKPTFILENVKGHGNLHVKYQLPSSSVYKKPILLSLFTFVILLVWIAINRIELRAFRSKIQ